MSTAPKKKGPEALERLPSHVTTNPAKDMEMNRQQSTMPGAAVPARPVVTIPESFVDTLSLLDLARDTLRTVHIAMSPEAKPHLDETALFSIWATIDRVQCDLDALRSHMDGGQS